MTPKHEPEVSKGTEMIIVEGHDDSAKRDFEMARANVIETMGEVSEAVTELSGLASQSQHPRAYEVLGQLLKTKLETSKELMNLQKDIRSLANANTPNSEEGRTVNQLFVGSTHDMQQMLAAARKAEEQ